MNKNNVIHSIIILFFIVYYINFKLINFYDYFYLVAYFTLFQIFISLIIYKKLTLIGYFIGFVVQWIIFLNVNPYPLVNNNKMAIMNLIPKKYVPKQQFLLSEIDNIDIEYPIIIKPIICSGGCKDIIILYSELELKHYLNQNKDIDKTKFMIQQYLYDYSREIGVLWEKNPWEKNGKVIEIVEKTQKELLRPFNENNFKNYSYLINDKINRIFNNISKKVPNLNVGRYDIRFKNTNDLQYGDFKILEVNGTMGMSYLGHPLYLGFLVDLKWYLSRLLIGSYNIITFQGYSPINLPIAMFKSFMNTIQCRDWENIYSLYS